MEEARRVLLLTGLLCVICCVHPVSSVIDPLSTLQCLKREFTYPATVRHTLDSGELLECTNQVTVDVCWGRCDSSEASIVLHQFRY